MKAYSLDLRERVAAACQLPSRTIGAVAVSKYREPAPASTFQPSSRSTFSPSVKEDLPQDFQQVLLGGRG